MKYILLMNNMTAGETYAGVTGWQQKDIQAHTMFLKELTKSLVASGELVSTEGLALPDQARIVRAGTDGAPRNRRRLPGERGVPGRLLDRRRGQPGAGLFDRRPRFARLTEPQH